jgi:hypothetical protein
LTWTLQTLEMQVIYVLRFNVGAWH